MKDWNFTTMKKNMPKHVVFLDISCPGGSLPCNGNGQCDHTTGLCTCNEGNQGSDCSGNSYNLWSKKYTSNLSSSHESQLFLPGESLWTLNLGFSLKNCRFSCESLNVFISKHYHFKSKLLVKIYLSLYPSIENLITWLVK